MSIALFSMVIVTLFVLSFANEANASHFRYGHLTYVKDANSNATVIFTLTDAFRRSGYGAVNVGDEIIESVGATSLAFGDGSFTPTLHYRVIAIDAANDWLIGRALEVGDTSKQTLTHTYTAPGPFVAQISSCCRTGVEINNPGQSYQVSTIVDVTNNNNSPVSSLPTIVNLVQGPASSFSVPALDPDPNTTLRWRFATLAEMGGVSQNPPQAGAFAATINPLTGLVVWNTTSAVLGGLYSCQVIIEDRAANDTTILKTQVAVDFLISILPQCTNPNFPTFDPPTPTCGSVIVSTPGVPIAFTVQASDADPGNVSLNASGLPAGSSMNPVLPTSGNPVSSNFSWTPTVAQIGPHVVAFIATDSCGAQTICNISFDIALPVELSSFTSSVTGNDVTLNWSTVTESNNARFEIERANLGSAEWRSIGTVAGNGNSSTPISYSYTDRGVNIGSYSYRLKQVDFNGNTEYHILNGDVVIGTPSKFELSQNYPNPFNPVTKIDFEIPVDGKVSLNVYDMSGKLVSTLVNNFRTAGYYSEVFNASNFASGVYYYKLQYSSNGQSFEKTMKMVLLK